MNTTLPYPSSIMFVRSSGLLRICGVLRSPISIHLAYYPPKPARCDADRSASRFGWSTCLLCIYELLHFCTLFLGFSKRLRWQCLVDCKFALGLIFFPRMHVVLAQPVVRIGQAGV